MAKGPKKRRFLDGWQRPWRYACDGRPAGWKFSVYSLSEPFDCSSMYSKASRGADRVGRC